MAELVEEEGYGEEGGGELVEDSSVPPRNKGCPWSEKEHAAFLSGLNALGKGNWRGISRMFVPSRSPTQVASHAQKYFLRLQGGTTKRRSRFSALETHQHQHQRHQHQRHPVASPSSNKAAAAPSPPASSGPPPCSPATSDGDGQSEVELRVTAVNPCAESLYHGQQPLQQLPVTVPSTTPPHPFAAQKPPDRQTVAMFPPPGCAPMFSFPPMMFTIPGPNGQPMQMMPPMFFPPTAGMMLPPPPWMMMGCPPPFPDASALLKAAAGSVPPGSGAAAKKEASVPSFPSQFDLMGGGDRVSSSSGGDGSSSSWIRERRESSGPLSLIRPAAARPTCSLTSGSEQLLRSLSATSLCTMVGDAAAQQAALQLPPVAPLLQPSLHSAFARLM